jgi:tripartite-type tricarboxylate transporter receptor subunit TctC
VDSLKPEANLASLTTALRATAALATGTAQRLPQLPDVPTVAEQGFKGFEMTQWYGLLALSVGNTSAEFDAFIKAEQARWKTVIARAEIKPEGV